MNNTSGTAGRGSTHTLPTWRSLRKVRIFPTHRSLSVVTYHEINGEMVGQVHIISPFRFSVTTVALAHQINLDEEEEAEPAPPSEPQPAYGCSELPSLSELYGKPLAI